ncbi:hypothetical protein HYH03_019120 [Edaphochlamys debaryana]|uniref:Uncharacterized protein n=1 Tax=Edaphochlamys debaryana TaxID=47281 RepID=A0A835XDD8_9CHLO|nr:hypothetical protein HYH03_019120 [Edaphochlamys debaryana]|eukprot:KAG2481923.1 hypothetical protein HYH03_019120 [Edaphochlamys debaryana]
MEEAFITHAHIHAQMERDLAASVLGAVQQRIDTACQRLCDRHASSCQSASFRWVVSDEGVPLATVQYVGLNCSGPVYLSSAACDHCGATLTPTAMEAGCFVSSPVVAHTWYDIQVHKAYGLLCCDGLSVTAFTDFLGAVAVGSAPLPQTASDTGSDGAKDSASEDSSAEESDLDDASGSTGSVMVDSRRFFASFMACQRARFSCNSLERLGVKGMDTGPLCACPFCARRPQPTGAHAVHAGGAEALQGTTESPYPLAVAMDACGNKLGHYASCGAASRDLRPRLSRFFGPVDTRVRSLHQQGRLNLQNTLGQAEVDDEAPACVCPQFLG